MATSVPKLALLALAAACSPRATTVPAAPDAARGEVVFFDDFAGPALDRAKWNVEVTGRSVNNEQQAYVDSPEVIRLVRGAEAAGATNGALELRAVRRPGFVTADGKTFDFLSGRINTRGKMEFAYGTAAARIRMAAGSGLWPAFWALGAGPWPATGEIDVMEFVGEREWTSAALHGPGYSGNTPLVLRQRFPAGGDATGWHVYAVSWGPDSLLFTVDAAPVYRVTRAQVERYGRWAFDNPKFLILNLALGGNYPAAVNAATRPYPGLPAPTVAQIERGEGTMLVDWVRVTRR